MTDLERIQRDKATILTIIKYAMFLAIAAAVVYYGLRLFVILIPFVIGFVLARVANLLASSWRGMTYKTKRRMQARSQAADARKSALSGEQPTEVPEKAAVEPAKPEVQQHRKTRGIYPRGLARSKLEIRTAVVFYVLEVIALIALVVVTIAISANQLRALANYLPVLFRDTDLSHRIIEFLRNISDQLGGILSSSVLQSIETELANLQQKIIQAMPSIATTILNSLAAFVSYLPILIFIIIVVIMSGYYFITDSRRLYVFLRRNVTSKSFREKSIRLVNSLSTTLFRVIGGYLLLLIVTFIEALIGLMIIKMPYAVIIALVCAVVDFLPVLGASATLIPVSIYMFANGSLFGGIGAIILLAAMTFIRRIIEPPVLGTAMSLHPMATLAAMIIGIALYGLSGIIIGPVILVIAKEVLSLYGFDKKIRQIIGEALNKVSS